jgi:hypothetical protein
VVGSAFGWSLESDCRFCVDAFGRNLASVAVKMFSNLIYCIKKCYTFCTFNDICKYNAAVDFIVARHKKAAFPSTSTGRTALVFEPLSNADLFLV